MEQDFDDDDGREIVDDYTGPGHRTNTCYRSGLKGFNPIQTPPIHLKWIVLTHVANVAYI